MWHGCHMISFDKNVSRLNNVYIGERTIKKVFITFFIALVAMTSICRGEFNFVNDTATEKKVAGKWQIEGMPVQFSNQYVASLNYGLKCYRFIEKDIQGMVFAIAKEAKDSSFSVLMVGQISNGELKSAGSILDGFGYQISFFGNDHMIFDNRISDSRMVLKAVRIKAENSATTKKADLLEYVKLSGNPFIQNILNAIQNDVRNKYKNVPPAAWNEISYTPDFNQAAAHIVPIYDKYFSRAEIRELIAFYKSPVFQKFWRVLPKIGEESEAAGKKLRNEIFSNYEKSLRKKGYIK